MLRFSCGVEEFGCPRRPHKPKTAGPNPASASMVMSVEWHREYQRQRCAERLALARQRLGGCCVRCGSTEDLDFDHIVPGSKVRKISEATNWSLVRFLAEVDKCQLLCKPCHREKSAETGENGAVEHGGGLKGKNRCTCELCRMARRNYQRRRRAATDAHPA